MAGSFYRQREIEKWLCPWYEGNLQEVKKKVCVQKWTKLCCQQEAKALSMHQRGLLMVRHICNNLLIKL